MSTLVSSSAPSFVLLGASTKSMCLKKLSHPSSLSRQVKWWFYLQNYNNYNISNSSCCPHVDSKCPPSSGIEQHYHHTACQKNPHPSLSMASVNHNTCGFDPWCTWCCHRTSDLCIGLPWCSLWFCATNNGSNSCKLYWSQVAPQTRLPGM